VKVINKIYCWLRGHDMISEGTTDNGQSLYGGYRCMRCGKIHNWQFDK